MAWSRVVSRATGMLLRPGRTWDEIAAEPADPRWLLARYVAPLAAIPAVCGLVGALAFGFNIGGVGVRVSPGGLLLGAAAGYGLTLLGVFLLAAFVDVTAPTFGGTRGRGPALQLVAYAATAMWIGGLAGIYPSLGLPAGILAGLYSLYALYAGLPKLMGVPEGRRLTAFAAILIAVLALAVARGLITARAAELGGPLSATYAPR